MSPVGEEAQLIPVGSLRWIPPEILLANRAGNTFNYSTHTDIVRLLLLLPLHLHLHLLLRLLLLLLLLLDCFLFFFFFVRSYSLPPVFNFISFPEPPPPNLLIQYSFGLVLWEIACRAVPFQDLEHPSHIRAAIVDGARPAIPPSCPPAYADMMEGCWHCDPGMRWDMGKVVDALTALKEDEEARELAGNKTPALTPRGQPSLDAMSSNPLSSPGPAVGSKSAVEPRSLRAAAALSSLSSQSSDQASAFYGSTSSTQPRALTGEFPLPGDLIR